MKSPEKKEVKNNRPNLSGIARIAVKGITVLALTTNCISAMLAETSLEKDFSRPSSPVNPEYAQSVVKWEIRSDIRHGSWQIRSLMFPFTFPVAYEIFMEPGIELAARLHDPCRYGFNTQYPGCEEE